jgi:capsular polysaccharide biosynthesis protein
MSTSYTTGDGARPDGDEFVGDEGVTVQEVMASFRRRYLLLTLGPLAAGLLSLVVTTFVIAPTFTASAVLMPPQQSQGGAAAALASLGPLASLAGGAAGVRNSGEQYVALMQSAGVSDSIIDRFHLMDVYEKKFRVDTRKALAGNVRISLGKRDGLITIEVDDKSPQRAADVANRYVDELKRVTGRLAVTEAQQRRMFFEQQLEQSRDRLVKAQQALQSSGFNASALKAEPKAAADTYARLRAETTAAEVRLQVTRGVLTDNSPEVRQQQAALAALRSQIAQVEQATVVQDGPDYIGRYREFKYQEALFEVYARQYELARVDESREGALIQVVDAASPPERKSKPARGMTAIVTTALAALALMAWVWARRAPPQPSPADQRAANAPGAA